MAKKNMTQALVKQQRAGRPTKVTYEARVKEIAAYILSCKTRAEIIDHCEKKYGLRESSVSNLVTNAYKYIKDTHSVDKDNLLIVHVQYYYDLYSMSKGLGDARGCVAALQAIEKLYKMVSPEVAIQQNSINLNLKDLSLNELKDLLQSRD